MPTNKKPSVLNLSVAGPFQEKKKKVDFFEKPHSIFIITQTQYKQKPNAPE